MKTILVAILLTTVAAACAQEGPTIEEQKVAQDTSGAPHCVTFSYCRDTNSTAERCWCHWTEWYGEGPAPAWFDPNHKMKGPELCPLNPNSKCVKSD